MLLSTAQSDMAIDTEFIESMSSLIAARREVIETHTLGGPALVRRDTDEELFTIMAEVCHTHRA